MKRNRTTAPKSLGATGRELWRAIDADYRIDDAAARELLLRACIAADRADQARAAIEAHGVVAVDARGRIARNPATAVERDSVQLMLAALRALGCAEPPRIGKPVVS